MPRSLFRDTVAVRGPVGMVPLSGATVNFYQDNGGTLTPIDFPLYPNATDPNPLALPYITGTLGELEVWADQPHRVRIIATKSGLNQADETIDIEPRPEDVATTEDITNAITAHEERADPHPQYLTQPEGDLLYLPLSYVPPPTDLSDYYTRGEADTAFLDEGEADLRYEQLSRKGMPSGYAPLDLGGVIPTQYLPALAITETFVVTSEAEMLALPAQQGDVAVRLDTTENYILAADPATVLANWTKLAASTTAGNTSVLRREEFTPAAAATTVTLAAPPTTVHGVTRNGVGQSEPAGHYTVAGLVLTFTDPFVAGERVAVVYEIGNTVPAPVNGYTKEESDTRYVNTAGDTMTGPLTVNDGWSAAVLGFGAVKVGTGNDEVRLYGQAASGGLIQMVNRTATIAGESSPSAGIGVSPRLSVYGPALVTGALTIGTANSAASGSLRLPNAQNIAWRNATNSADRTLGLNASNNLVSSASVVVQNSNGFAVQLAGETYSRAYLSEYAIGWGPGNNFADTSIVRDNVGVLLVSGQWSPDTTNTYDLGTTSRRWKKLWATDADFTNAPTVGGSPLQTQTAADTRYVNVAGDQMTGNLGVGVAPAAWGAAYKALQVGNFGVLGDTGGVAQLLGNSYYDGTAYKAAINAVGVQAALQNGFSLSTAPAVAAGAAQTFTTRLTVTQTGTLTLTPDAGQAALVMGATQLRHENIAGAGESFLVHVAGIDQVGVNNGALFPRSHNVVALGAPDRYWSLAFFNNIRMNGFEGDGQGMMMRGAPLHFANAAQTYSVGWRCKEPNNGIELLSNGAATGLSFDSGGSIKHVSGMGIYGPAIGHNLYLTGWGSVLFTHMGGGYVGPQTDNAYSIGGAGFRWTTIHAANGTIQTSHVSEKEAFAPLDPAECATAVLETDWIKFSYLPPRYEPPTISDDDLAPGAREAHLADDRAAHVKQVAETAYVRHQKGYALGSPAHKVHDLFGLDDRRSVNSQSDLAVVACALQQALRDIADLKARLPA